MRGRKLRARAACIARRITPLLRSQAAISGGAARAQDEVAAQSRSNSRGSTAIACASARNASIPCVVASNLLWLPPTEQTWDNRQEQKHTSLESNVLAWGLLKLRAG